MARAECAPLDADVETCTWGDWELTDACKDCGSETCSSTDVCCYCYDGEPALNAGLGLAWSDGT